MKFFGHSSLSSLSFSFGVSTLYKAVNFYKMSQVKIGKWMYKQIQINGERVTTNESFKYCLLSNPNRMEVSIKQS